MGLRQYVHTRVAYAVDDRDDASLIDGGHRLANAPVELAEAVPRGWEGVTINLGHNDDGLVGERGALAQRG